MNNCKQHYASIDPSLKNVKVVVPISQKNPKSRNRLKFTSHLVKHCFPILKILVDLRFFQKRAAGFLLNRYEGVNMVNM